MNVRNVRWSVMAVVMAVAPMTVLSPGAAGSTGDSSPTCASGRGVAVAPHRVRRDARGGAFYDYTVDGVTLTSAEAPPGLDLTSATDGELSTYGLPPRPTGEGLGEWLRAMRSYRSGAANAAPSLCLRPDLAGAGTVGLQTPCTTLCTNAAGRWGTLGGYTAVTANVTVPAMSAVGNCSEYGHISAWVGIGTELNTGGLLQAGTITELYPNQNMLTYGFYEWVAGTNGGPTIYPVVSSWNALPGHELFERVQVNTITHGVNFYVQNISTGQHLTVTAGGIWADYDPDSAGWIVENHTRENQSNVKTGPWNWTNALVTRYSTTTYGGSTQSPTTATGAEGWPAHPNFGDIVESTNAWTSTTSFPAVWYACR